jgi:CheY-like chemotaxis protein/HPt (histidine-containing phosphotransfer) domain-containing protein
VLLAIINDILDFSKIEAGRMELALHPFDVRECIESAIDLVAPKAAEKNLDLVCTVDECVPAQIFSDPTRLRQVLLNLLSNATKFTHAGEVEVQASCEKISSLRPATGTLGTYMLRFSVRDTGIGIPKQRMDRLFQSFSQLDASMNRKYGGTGLGLVISKRLVELLGGEIWVDSEVGRGSTFHFTVRAPAIETRKPAYLDPEQLPLKGKRLLAVDDQPASRQWLAHQVQAWGLEAVTAASAAEALELRHQAQAAGTPFDVAIVDMNMPDMDGLVLAEAIRAEEYRAHEGIAPLPLVLLTPVGSSSQAARLPRFTTSLHKPVKPQTLYGLLLQILAGQAQGAQAEGAYRTMGGFAPSGAYQQAERGSEFDAYTTRGQAVKATGPLHILLVEDNPINQKLALLILQRLGYAADLATTGQQALEILHHQSYEVVLMDVQMPEMDGLEATRRIRLEFPPAEGGRRLPYVIAMTANAMIEDREICLQAGMDDYLSKPIQIGDLVAALTTAGAALGSHAPQAGGAAPAEALTDQPYGQTNRSSIPAVSARIPTAPLPETPAEAPVIDPVVFARLQTTLGAQAETMLPGLIANFCVDASQLILDAQQALAQGQAAVVSRAAHTLKSTSATFGATQLSELARQLEFRARDGVLDGAQALLAQIQAAYERTWAALELHD